MTTHKDRVTEIRWHGRGGQGAVTSAELVATAAIHEGKYAQAMPSFGPERRGAPVLAFNRVSDSTPIRARAPVTDADVVVVLGPDLLNIMDVTAGLKPGGALIINSPKNIEELKSEFGGPWKLAVVNATAIAKEILGVPIVNTTMIGALVKVTGVFNLASLEAPLKERFGAKAKNNFSVCQKAFDEVKILEPVAAVAGPRKTFETETLLTWKQILPGCVIDKPGNASSYRTGDWKSQHPEYVYKKCIKCGLCFLFCPEGCIEPKGDGYFQADLFYCKGCALCAKECPTKAINMIEES